MYISGRSVLFVCEPGRTILSSGPGRSSLIFLLFGSFDVIFAKIDRRRLMRSKLTRKWSPLALARISFHIIII